MRLADDNIIRLKKNQIFVYGSNLAGIHGKGAAFTAYKKFGATRGRCHGLDNNSYGIPTKDEKLNVLPLERIKKYVLNFIWDASNYPELEFMVTAVGTGLSGYKPIDIAPMFRTAMELENVFLPKEFWDVLLQGNEKNG